MNKSNPSNYNKDPILKKWINPRYLDPSYIFKLRQTCESKPYMKYLVLDDFYNEKILAKYFAKHKKLPFKPDDKGLPYDSQVVFGSPKEIGGELFFHSQWNHLLRDLSGTQASNENQDTVVKIRRHQKRSKGFWIHTDNTFYKPSRLGVMSYLNLGWRISDGALFQLWQTEIVSKKSAKVDYSWKKNSHKRLDFLNEKKAFSIEVAAPLGIEPREVTLIDQILPLYNRVVLVDFSKNPSYHSITPSSGKTRYAIVQWLF